MALKYRLIISFIVALWLLWFAVPRLPLYGTDLQFGFSVLWLAFCLLVIGANLHALLRLGRGEAVERHALNKEQREVMKRLQRARKKRRRMMMG
ncbi:cbb3-type cytochrome oxidase subunit 3 [Caldalkalibacillus uzonensis]|uniref:Cbb3-type cytochrome oxidase subunit 3 n=1 Tax=Caldalkalibacillus uzonensis TaxID=353224 RepID=A0ABU0CP79_9BACI|nr:hypothetical protein [Caldalkalibacillus uzonensis]MDQ0337893.1 cbb3-type cytochrome oxidase subunit 3 [Caldalkalibacillus uzonensis]